tara:strand:- start:257 stop:397 length:141 start_codon:yes stop_codon:yes gene_type:complete
LACPTRGYDISLKTRKTKKRRFMMEFQLGKNLKKNSLSNTEFIDLL